MHAAVARQWEASGRILAIDPGPERSAWLYRDGKMLAGYGIFPNADLLDALRTAFDSDAFEDYPFAPATVVIEEIQSFGMAVGREVFNTVRWAGRFEEAVAPLPVVLMPRRTVKLHLCGTARAKDANIRQALIDRFGGPAAIGTTKTRGPLYGISKDVWSALAIAVTYSDGIR